MNCYHNDAMDILASIFPDLATSIDKDRAKSKEYYALARCKVNPKIVHTETVEQYRARESAEFMAMLEA